MDIQVSLPPLHTGRNGSGGQVAVDECGARFTVCFCGRRWGKTTLGVRKCVKCALEIPNSYYWWIGPSYPVISNSRAWPMLKYLTRQLPETKIYESDRYVRIYNGSEIWVKSADKEDSLRGPGLSGTVLDEFPQIAEARWTDEIRPALSDHKGWAMFIGTPKGKNWAYKLYDKAESRKNWARFKRPSLDNPFLDPEEIEEAREELTEAKFKQEYEADFGASQYLVWQEFDRDIHKWRWDIPEFTHFFGGLDFGGDSVGAHLSAGVVAGLTKQDILVLIAEFAEAGPNIGERQIAWMQRAQDVCNRISLITEQRPKKINWTADKTQMWGISQARNLGFSIIKSKGGRDSINQGCDAVARRLVVRGDGRARLYYLPGLSLIPDAFETYRYPEPIVGMPSTGIKPLAVDDDIPDTIRYLVEGRDRIHLGDPAEIYGNVLPSMQQRPPGPLTWKEHRRLRKRRTLVANQQR